MNEDAVKTLLLFIGAGKEILSARIVLVLTLFMAFGLVLYAAIDPLPMRLGCAFGFAIVVFLPVLSMDKRAAKGASNVGTQQQSPTA